MKTRILISIYLFCTGLVFIIHGLYGIYTSRPLCKVVTTTIITIPNTNSLAGTVVGWHSTTNYERIFSWPTH